MTTKCCIKFSGILGQCGTLETFLGYSPANDLYEVSSADVLDDDRGTAASSLQALAEDQFIAAHAAFLYESPSRTPDCPKSRIVFILDQPFSSAEGYRDAPVYCVGHSRLPHSRPTLHPL